MKNIICFIALFYLSSVFSEENWKIPDSQDRESACRTILYEVQASENVEDILILQSTYRLLCENKIEHTNSTYKSIFLGYSKYMKELSQSPSLTNKVACIDTQGYVMQNNGGGWDHMELEKYNSFNEQTNGGWNHMEIQSYLKAKPLLKTLSTTDIRSLEQFIDSGLTVEDVENAMQLWQLEAFKNSASDIQDINNRINSLNLEELNRMQLNKQFQ